MKLIFYTELIFAFTSMIFHILSEFRRKEYITFHKIKKVNCSLVIKEEEELLYNSSLKNILLL